MQFKLSTAVLTALVAAMSVSALPTRGADFTDLAARSTAEDLAYLEARYSPEVDYETYFARDVAPTGGDVVELVARNSLLQLMGLARNQMKLDDDQKKAFDKMDTECEEIKDKKDKKQCHKYVKHLREIIGEARWGFDKWYHATKKDIPAGVQLDLGYLSGHGPSKTLTSSTTSSTTKTTSVQVQQPFPMPASPYGASAGYPMPGYPNGAPPSPYAYPVPGTPGWSASSYPPRQ